MNEQVTAMISWIAPQKGGRSALPTGPIYSTLVRFDEDKNWPTQAWSARLEFIRSYAAGQYLFARVNFLSSDAPMHLLHEGSRFQLYEGRKLVATGLVRAGDAAPIESIEFEQALLH
jgi:hypothetical protein